MPVIATCFHKKQKQNKNQILSYLMAWFFIFIFFPIIFLFAWLGFFWLLLCCNFFVDHWMNEREPFERRGWASLFYCWPFACKKLTDHPFNWINFHRMFSGNIFFFVSLNGHPERTQRKKQCCFIWNKFLFLVILAKNKKRKEDF